MNTFNTNVVMHIDEDLSDNQIQEIEKHLSSHQGVVSACVHERARHLWVIDYDPRETHSETLLANIHNRGLHAELVGGV